MQPRSVRINCNCLATWSTAVQTPTSHCFGANGTVDSRNSSKNKIESTGSFAYADGHITEVTASDRLFTRAANARVDISITDSVTESSAELIVLTANRDSTSITQCGSGIGLANTTPAHEFRVCFNVTDTPVR